MSAAGYGPLSHPRARRHLFHPSRKRLQQWLDGDEADLDPHLATCSRCADRLEVAASAAPAQSLTQALLVILAAPADLQPRLREGISARMQARDDLSVLAGMLGVPAETLGLLIAPPPGDEDDAAPGSR